MLTLAPILAADIHVAGVFPWSDGFVAQYMNDRIRGMDLVATSSTSG